MKAKILLGAALTLLALRYIASVLFCVFVIGLFGPPVWHMLKDTWHSIFGKRAAQKPSYAAGIRR